MKHKIYLLFLGIAACLIAILIFNFLHSPIQIVLLHSLEIEKSGSFRLLISAIILLPAVTHYWLTMEYHELAHWKEAAKYHTLDNPRMTNDHFDWDNKKDFSLKEISQIALAGIKFDIKNNIAWLLLGLLEPLTIPFFILTMMFGNAIPVKFSERSATDGYWYLHSNEFTSF